MNTPRAKILLDKVNALFKSMSIDEVNVTAIEKDLMLSYLRQLYDSVLEANTTTRTSSSSSSTFSPSPAPKHVVSKPVYKPPRIIEIPDSLREDIRTPEPPPKTKTKKKNKSKSKNISKPRIIVPPKLDPIPEPRYTPPPVIAQPTPPPPPPQPEPTPIPEPQPKPTPTPVVDTKHDELFQFKVAKELSEKLSQRPIRDLTKAFSLNDKLLYANELFGKELVVFNNEVRKLNSLDNFNEAKSYLAQLADKFNWSSKSKIPMAKGFVLLVKRRFS